MSELTQLGKFLRKLRIDRGELLKDMASKLGVAVSFVSAVENGKKRMPTEWAPLISKIYEFTESQQKDFDVAIAESEKSVDVRFDGLSPENRQLSVAFARKIKNLGKAEQEQLMKILF